MKEIIIITGALGAGKTTFGEALAAQGLIFLPAKNGGNYGADFCTNFGAGADVNAGCAAAMDECAKCGGENGANNAAQNLSNSNLDDDGSEIRAEFDDKNGEICGENPNENGEENHAQNSQNLAQNPAQTPAQTTPPTPLDELATLQNFYFKNAISFACEHSPAAADEIFTLTRRARQHGFKTTLVFLGFGELELFVARAAAAQAGFAARVARVAKSAQTDGANSNLGGVGGEIMGDFGAEFDHDLDENFKISADFSITSERENGAVLAQTGEILAQVVGELGAALAHFGGFCAACDEVVVFDNSRQKPRVLLRVVGGAVDFLVPADLRPRWLTDLAREVLSTAKTAPNPTPKMAKNGENQAAQNPAQNVKITAQNPAQPAPNPAPNSNLSQNLAQNQNENPATNSNLGEISNQNPAQNEQNCTQNSSKNRSENQPKIAAKTTPKRAENLRDLFGKI